MRRLSADFQNTTSLAPFDEISTTLAAGPGGTGGFVTYSKTIKIPRETDVLFITFSAQGDSHNGSALLMTATVNGALIEPLAGQTGFGGGGPHLQTGWYTLSHLPAPGVDTNCNDGGGGTGDCHDNAISFTGCARLAGATGEGEHEGGGGRSATVEIKLGNLPGGDNNVSFYERASIYVDGQSDEDGRLCKGAGLP